MASNSYPKAGDLINRITIQTVTKTQNSTGDQIETWYSIGNFAANVRSASGTEKMIGEKLQAQVSHAITIRYIRGVTLDPTMRILYNGQIYNIVNVLDMDGRRRALNILALRTSPQSTGITLYWGSNSNTTLTSDDILALNAATLPSTTYSNTTYDCPSGGYKYFCLPTTVNALSNMTDPNSGFAVDLATDDPYTLVSNGLNYTIVPLGGTDYQVYRSENVLGGTLTLEVS